MRHIQKVISREHIISRLPSVWPAYNGDELYFFDNESIADRDGLYPSNYGLVPMSVKLSGITISNGNISVSYSPETYAPLIGLCGLSGICSASSVVCYDISFERIAQMYSFFVDYYNLLTTKGYCGQVYNKAIDYYNTESTVNKQPALYYGDDEQTYIDLDSKFVAYGGKEMFKWICKYVMPSFEIPAKLKDAWGRSFLYYPDALYWYAWFNEKRELYSAYTNNCSASTDCCECEKYFALGGGIIRPQLQNWYNNVQSAITEVKEVMKRPGTGKCFIPSMEMAIQLQNSIENAGCFDLILDEYELGENYYGTKAVVLHDGLPMIKNSSGGHPTGYKFDTKFMELTYDSLAWSSYTKAYSSGYTNSPGHEDEFYNPYLYYAFLSNDKKVVGKTTTQVKSKCFIQYEIEVGSWVLGIDDEVLYNIDKKELGHYNGSLVVVYRERHTQTPYVIVRGKTIYGLMKNGRYEFPFMEETFDREYDASSAEEYIVDGGVVKTVSSLLNEDGYARINAYCEVEDDKYYSVDGEINGYHYVTSALTIQEMEQTLEQRVFTSDTMSEFDIVNHTMSLYENPVVRKSTELTGVTSSKLMSLRSVNLLSDDIGNMIESLPPDITGRDNAQPYEGQVLEPIYQVGNYANIQKFTLRGGTKDAYEVSGLTFGDIITNMEVYYKDSHGDEMPETRTVCTRNNVISAITTAYDLITSTDIIDPDIVWCDITYRVGATLSGTSNGMKTYNSMNQGVEYTETVKMVKENAMYCLRKRQEGQTPMTENCVSAHTVSYPISIYKVYQENETVYSDTYGSSYDTPMATFKTTIPHYDIHGVCNPTKDMEDSNGTEVYPVFMKPYGIGVATPKTTTSNIYIDRGVNAALDRHLKLGEVLSLEALENYGNNYFNVTSTER